MGAGDAHRIWFPEMVERSRSRVGWRPMRVLATLLLMVGRACDESASATAGQDSVPAAQASASGPARIPAEPSDLLTHSPLTACSAGDAPNVHAPKRSRIVTWNIRAARSAPVDAIAAELQAMQADVIALQEVDVRTRRTGFVDQPAALATALGFHYVFAASIKWDEGDYGLAVLSRWPLTEVRRHRLAATAAGEPRIVLEVTVCAEGGRCAYSTITLMGVWRRGSPGSPSCERSCRRPWGTACWCLATSTNIPTPPACAA